MRFKTQDAEERQFLVEDNRIEILMELGLTSLQAKIYLALSQTGNATIRNIAKNSKIARQDVYRIMPSLQKLGLAEQIVVSPTMYKSTPLKDGYNLLLQKKKNEHMHLQKKTATFIKNLHENNNKVLLDEEDTHFVITYSKTLLSKRFLEEEEMVQNSIDTIGTWDMVRRILFYRSEHFDRLLKRDVKIRIITEKAYEDYSVKKNVQELMMNPWFEIRYLSTTIPIETTIYDGKEVNFCLATPSVGNGLPSLWSNNQQFVKIMSIHFEEVWKKANESSNSYYRTVENPL